MRWRDVARPNLATLDDLLAGLVAEETEAPAAVAARRYLVTLSEVKLDLCAAWNGIGPKPKGRGSVALRFVELNGATGATIVSRVVTTPLNLDGRDPRRDSNIVREAIARAAHDFFQTAR